MKMTITSIRNEVKNEWSYTSTSLYAFMGWTGKYGTVVFLQENVNSETYGALPFS
jgi:hypothetical protein